MMVPLLLKPKLYTLRNRWTRRSIIGYSRWRDAALTALSVGMMYATYRGTLELLEKVSAALEAAYLSPSTLLGLLFVGLFFLLLFSNSIAALGALFLSNDLDLNLASPIRPMTFFWSKLLEILGSASWMSAIFVLPIVTAFGVHFQSSIEYYLFTIITLIPYFAIPAACSMLAVTIFARLVPAGRTRFILIGVGVMALTFLYLTFESIMADEPSLHNVNDVLQLLALFSLPNAPWTPSYWTAHSLEQILIGSPNSAMGTARIGLAAPYLILLYSTAVGLGAAAFLAIRFLYQDAYSRARGGAHGLRLRSKRAQRVLRAVTPFLSPPYRALIAKEIKLFARDMAQALQLLLLIGVCMIYLYNFRILRSVGELPQGSELWWEGVLVVCNVAMGAFVITAVGTRFVFPSISLEGQAYWILQSSPFPIASVLRAKFWCWLIPVATISSVILASGALAIHAAPRIVVLNALASWVICYGIVGLGVGLGAFFANFQWEHASQLAASFGSLLYMLTCTVLIFVNLVPTALLIFLRTLKLLGYTFSDLQWYIAVSITALLLVYINYATTRWALKLGEHALLERMR